MRIIRLSVGLLALAALTGCTTVGATITPATKVATEKVSSMTSPVVSLSGPYDAAKACIAKIPNVRQLNIGVAAIDDKTGKVNVAEGGSGSFISQGMSDAFYSSLFDLGVSVTDLTPQQQADVTFIAAAGVKGAMRTPSFIIRGSVNGLDLSQESNVGELTFFGVGPKARAYNAFGKMDLRMVTLPGGKLPANVMVAKSTPVKQFMAVEREVGFASFIGIGPGFTFASARIGNSVRELMQVTMSFMADYAVGDLVLDYLDDHGSAAQKAAVPGCRKLLEWSPKPVQAATAA